MYVFLWKILMWNSLWMNEFDFESSRGIFIFFQDYYDQTGDKRRRFSTDIDYIILMFPSVIHHLEKIPIVPSRPMKNQQLRYFLIYVSLYFLMRFYPRKNSVGRSNLDTCMDNHLQLLLWNYWKSIRGRFWVNVSWNGTFVWTVHVRTICRITTKCCTSRRDPNQ